MNWALIIFGAGLVASAIAYMLRLVVFDRLDKFESAMKESAKDQGTRIGKGEDRLAVLEDWRARTLGAEDRERDLSGRVRT
jgi:hypothetical protein